MIPTTHPAMTQNGNRTRSNGDDEDQQDIDQLAFIGTLAEGLAHEMRNPLSTININVQLLEEDWEQPETQRERDCFKRIQQLREQTEHLERILNQFLQFARGLDLQLEDIDLNTYLDEVLDRVEPRLDDKQVTLERDLSPGIPLVSIDREHFKRALKNLFENAMDALKAVEDGTIRVRTEETDDGNVLLTISDSGPGLPDDQLERAFDVFSSTKQGSTGLGLSISRRIIQEHGGTIKLKSPSGKGTHVHIQLPPAQSEQNVES